MGFNTTVIVMNDCLEAIAEDPKFGRHLAEAIRRTHLRNGEFGAGRYVAARGKRGFICVNAAKIVEQHHCDCWVLVMAGGNTARSLSDDEPWTDAIVTVLRNVAERHGYRLTRRRSTAPAARGRL